MALYQGVYQLQKCSKTFTTKNKLTQARPIWSLGEKSFAMVDSHDCIYLFFKIFIEILTTKQQWLKIDKNSEACWTSSSVSSVLLYHWLLEMFNVSDHQKH